MTSSPVAARCRQQRTSSAVRRGRTCAAIHSMRRAPSRVHTRARPRHARTAERRLACPFVAGAARCHSAARRATGCSCPKADHGHRRASPTRRPARRASCRHICARGAGRTCGGRHGRLNLGSRPRARRQAGGGGRARRAPPPRRERRSFVSCGPTRTGGRGWTSRQLETCLGYKDNCRTRKWVIKGEEAERAASGVGHFRSTSDELALRVH